jgi:hypothetical protein
MNLIRCVCRIAAALAGLAAPAVGTMTGWRSS